MTRYLCLAGLLAGLSAFAALVFAEPPESQVPQPQPLSVKLLKDGIYWVEGGAGANTGFRIGRKEVVVIDAKMTADSAREMLAQIGKLTPNPVTTVILTHSDLDHVNGLAGFPKGLTI
jgi:cyclase